MANFQTLPTSPPQLLCWGCLGLQEIYGLHLPFTLRQTPGLRSKGPNHTPSSTYTIYQSVSSPELFSFFVSTIKTFLFFYNYYHFKEQPTALFPSRLCLVCGHSRSISALQAANEEAEFPRLITAKGCERGLVCVFSCTFIFNP